jgi:Tannase and feruloyl esterase
MASLQPSPHVNCTAQSIPYPNLPGAQIRSLEAVPVHKGWKYIPKGFYSNNGAVGASSLHYCNVTITYTPLDSTNLTEVQIWLPETWNGRMQGVGGGGWSAGLYTNGYPSMTAAVAQGFAVTSTNGGYTTGDARDWALLAPGKVDYKSLQHYATTSLNDLAVIGKDVVKSFYGTPPRFSYWNGCSQGGRQGFMLAQRYPKAFDGIVGSSPALNYGQLEVAGFWGQMIMNQFKEYPRPCELTALTNAAVKACDGNDGLVDGLVSDPDSCHFDPYTLVNTTAGCTGADASRKISSTAAYLAKTLWGGMKTSRHPYLSDFGMGHESPMVTGVDPMIDPLLPILNITTALVDTECLPNGTCRGKPFGIVVDWLQLFLKKDPNYDVLKIDQKEFDRMFEQSVREYNPIIGTDSTDLTKFRDAGGKILSYHGLVSI